MSVPDPTEWFARALRETLVRGKIPVKGDFVRTGSRMPGTVVLARVDSLPMASLASLCL